MGPGSGSTSTVRRWCRTARRCASARRSCSSTVDRAATTTPISSPISVGSRPSRRWSTWTCGTTAAPARHDPDAWTFEACADDVRAFCDAVGIARPIVLGHSMGGFIAMLYGARHPGHAGGLVLQSTWARFDLARIVDGFRAIAGDEVAGLAGRDYGGDAVSDEEWDRVFAAFGPHIPDADQLERRLANPAVNAPGMARMTAFDAVDQLARIDCPTLVAVGDLDPITPPAAAREIVAGLAPGIVRLEIIEGAGHFPWLDVAGPLLAGDRGIRDRRRLTVR